MNLCEKFVRNVFRDTYQKQVSLKYKSVEKYGEKILESFIYGYKLSNKLIIDSLK